MGYENAVSVKPSTHNANYFSHKLGEVPSLHKCMSYTREGHQNGYNVQDGMSTASRSSRFVSTAPSITLPLCTSEADAPKKIFQQTNDVLKVQKEFRLTEGQQERCSVPDKASNTYSENHKSLSVVTPLANSSSNAISDDMHLGNGDEMAGPTHVVQLPTSQTVNVITPGVYQTTNSDAHIEGVATIALIESVESDPSSHTSNTAYPLYSGNCTSIPPASKTCFTPLRLNKFVRRLHDMLISERNSGVVEWRRGLLVLHSTDAFAKKILPKYFNTRNFKTFRRQLNYYGFVHVRSFSATGSTTTALWVNQDLAKRGTKDIASILLLKRVEPCETAKTAYLESKRND